MASTTHVKLDGFVGMMVSTIPDVERIRTTPTSFCDRVTAGDVPLRDRKLAFHLGELPPVVTLCGGAVMTG